MQFQVTMQCCDALTQWMCLKEQSSRAMTPAPFVVEVLHRDWGWTWGNELNTFAASERRRHSTVAPASTGGLPSPHASTGDPPLCTGSSCSPHWLPAISHNGSLNPPLHRKLVCPTRKPVPQHYHVSPKGCTLHWPWSLTLPAVTEADPWGYPLSSCMAGVRFNDRSPVCWGSVC